MALTPSLTLLGSSSGRNMGDAAILASLMTEVDKAYGERLLYEIPTINPEFIWQNYAQRVRPLGGMPWHGALKLFGLPTYRSLLRTDMSLIFDATLFDRSLYNPAFNFLSSYYALLPFAKKKGKKMGCYTVTVGPVRTPKGKEMLRKVLGMMDFVTVRDQEAVDAMAEAGASHPYTLITSDTALLLEPAPKTKVDVIWDSFRFPEGHEVLAVNANPYFDTWADVDQAKLTRDRFVSIYAEGINTFLKDKDGISLLFMSSQHIDETLSKEIQAKISPKTHTALMSNKIYNCHDIRGVMERPSLLMAMRLHCIILTTAGYTPSVSLDYLPKVTSFMNSIGLNDHSLGFDHFTPDAVCEKLERGWKQRKENRSLLSQRVPKLQAQVRRAPELTARVLRGESVDAIFKSFLERDPNVPIARVANG